MASRVIGNVIGGTTSMSWPFVLVTTSGGAPETGKVAADMTAYYWRQGGSPTSITLSDLAAITSSFSSGGVKEAVNMQGSYRLDIPDAAIAAGVDWVEIAISTSTAYYQFFLAIFAGVDVAAINGVSTSPVTTVKAVQGLTTADTIAAVGANGITSSSLATDAINAASVKADAVTKIQTGLATPTNITAGTITTVTNLTNAPTNGDFTATMKASITSAVPTAAANAAATRDVNNTSPAANSLGAAVNAAASAGDPWATLIPGAYGAGTAGNIVGNNLDAPISGLPTADQMAEAVLTKDWTTIGSWPQFCILQAVRFLRNKWNTTDTPGTLSVYEEDGTTLAWSRLLDTDPNAQPITGAE